MIFYSVWLMISNEQTSTQRIQKHTNTIKELRNKLFCTVWKIMINEINVMMLFHTLNNWPGSILLIHLLHFDFVFSYRTFVKIRWCFRLDFFRSIENLTGFITRFSVRYGVYGINEVNVKTYKLPMEGYQTVFHCSVTIKIYLKFGFC